MSKATAKIKAVVMHIKQLLFNYKFTQPENFPEEISLIEYDGLFGLFCKTHSSLLTTISYKKIVYDHYGHNFLAYNNGVTYLINAKGKVIFSTYQLPSDEVKEYLKVVGDGTYLYITNNALTGKGWYTIVSRKGKIITKSEHHFL